jgi:hypothetical protein
MSKKSLKDRVASFRISQVIDNKVEDMLRASPIINCDTANKFYRKLALDWMAGRLAYKNPSDLSADPEVLDQMAALNQPPGQ